MNRKRVFPVMHINIVTNNSTPSLFLPPPSDQTIGPNTILKDLLFFVTANHFCTDLLK